MAASTSSRLAFDGITLRNVDWDLYSRLRDDPAHKHLRMAYLDGDLAITSPRLLHEVASRRMLLLVTAVVRAWRIPFQPTGSTTIRVEGRKAGKEPTEGFYFGNETGRGSRRRDVAPPPHLAIEVDNSINFELALTAYARLGVPEVWTHDARRRSLRISRLVAGQYVEADRSVALPRLTPELVLQALEPLANDVMTNLDWLDWLDPWARALPAPPAVP